MGDSDVFILNLYFWPITQRWSVCLSSVSTETNPHFSVFPVSQRVFQKLSSRRLWAHKVVWKFFVFTGKSCVNKAWPLKRGGVFWKWSEVCPCISGRRNHHSPRVVCGSPVDRSSPNQTPFPAFNFFLSATPGQIFGETPLLFNFGERGNRKTWNGHQEFGLWTHRVPKQKPTEVWLSLIFQGIEQLKKEERRWAKKTKWMNMRAVFGHPFSLLWFSPFSTPDHGKAETYQYVVWGGQSTLAMDSFLSCALCVCVCASVCVCCQQKCALHLFSDARRELSCREKERLLSVWVQFANTVMIVLFWSFSVVSEASSSVSSWFLPEAGVSNTFHHEWARLIKHWMILSKSTLRVFILHCENKNDANLNMKPFNEPFDIRCQNEFLLKLLHHGCFPMFPCRLEPPTGSCLTPLPSMVTSHFYKKFQKLQEAVPASWITRRLRSWWQCQQFGSNPLGKQEIDGQMIFVKKVNWPLSSPSLTNHFCFVSMNKTAFRWIVWR